MRRQKVPKSRASKFAQAPTRHLHRPELQSVSSRGESRPKRTVVAAKILSARVLSMTESPESEKPSRESFPEVPADLIAAGDLPPMRLRDLPEPVSIWKMVGPSIILAGLALGSGEFILWPYITFHSGFTFLWAAILGVFLQYMINLEIMRWTLATGESAMTGFVRMSRHWASLFLAMNVIPWMIPAWAKGAAQMISWTIWEPDFQMVNGVAKMVTPYETPLAIAGLILCGLILTAGPVIYETVEKIQFALVGMIILIVMVLAAWLVWLRPDGPVAMLQQVATFGNWQFVPPFDSHLTPQVLLGALAFAGAGGTLNLGQSNYIKDKGYGMGAYIGRLTSPLTGNAEPVTEVGYHFPPTEENMARWGVWWRNAIVEHFVSFGLTCVVTLVLLSLIAYIVFFDATGKPTADAHQYKDDLGFVWAEMLRLQTLIGPAVKWFFLVMGIAILLSTEFGVLDAGSRISTDIVKVAWLRDDDNWHESRIYCYFLWGTISLGILALLVGEWVDFNSFDYFKYASSMNGAVMAIYCGTLWWLNTRVISPALRMSWFQQGVIFLAMLFYGYFAIWSLWFILTGGK